MVAGCRFPIKSSIRFTHYPGCLPSMYTQKCGLAFISSLLVQSSASLAQQPEHFSLLFLLLKCSKLFTGSPSHHLSSSTKFTFLCNFYEALGPAAAHLSSFPLDPGKYQEYALSASQWLSGPVHGRPSPTLQLEHASSLARSGKTSPRQHSLTSHLSLHQAPNT